MSSRAIGEFNHPPEVIEVFREGSKKAARAIAEAVAVGAAKRSHVLTGKLAASWHAEEEGDHAIAVSDDPNAIYQEFGTSKMPAHPSLGPAEHVERQHVGRRVADVLNPLIEAACRL